MKSITDIHHIMAVFFCLFAFALCSYPTDNRITDKNYQQNHDDNSFDFKRPGALNAQIVSVSRPNVSPCPRVFRYLFDGEEWEGRVKVDSPAPRGLPSYLRVEMSVGFKYNSVSCRAIQIINIYLIKSFTEICR